MMLIAMVCTIATRTVPDSAPSSRSSTAPAAGPEAFAAIVDGALDRGATHLSDLDAVRRLLFGNRPAAT
jgi:hypothetical protein